MWNITETHKLRLDRKVSFVFSNMEEMGGPSKSNFGQVLGAEDRLKWFE